MSIAHASATIESLLRQYWHDDPRNQHRLDQLLVIFESGWDYGAWDVALGDVQTWPDELDDPIEFDDRIFWDFQAFIDSNHCTAFSADRTRSDFLKLVATLEAAGIVLPDADSVTFNTID